MIRIRELIKDTRGQALVELALILPILIMLLFGIIEFGRVFNAYLTVTNASREGARVAVVGANNFTINERVKTASPNLNHSDLKVTIAPLSNRTRGQSVTVTVEYKVKLYAPLVDVVIENPMTVSHKTTMRME